MEKITEADFVERVAQMGLDFETALSYLDTHIKGIEKRKEYANSPEAKAKAAERREKQKAEMAAFRAWQAQQAS